VLLVAEDVLYAVGAQRVAAVAQNQRNALFVHVLALAIERLVASVAN
jgi:hypothetical protein